MFSVMAHFLQIQSIFVRTFLGARSYPDSIDNWPIFYYHLQTLYPLLTNLIVKPAFSFQ